MTREPSERELAVEHFEQAVGLVRAVDQLLVLDRAGLATHTDALRVADARALWDGRGVRRPMRRPDRLTSHPCAGGRCPNPAAHAEGAHDL